MQVSDKLIVTSQSSYLRPDGVIQNDLMNAVFVYMHNLHRAGNYFDMA